LVLQLSWLLFSYRSVDALEAIDEFLSEGFAGFGPEKTAADAAVFFDQEGKG